MGALLSTVRAAPANNLPRADGSLSLVDGETKFTFDYATSAADSKNWIGIYHASGGGPEDEVMVSPSLKWGYAPESKGRLTIDASGLDAGKYKAFFLEKDGYKWLANPIEIAIAGTSKASFLTDKYTTHNARKGDKFEAKLGGLLSSESVESKFAKSSGPDWVKVSDSGVVSGTPDSDKTAEVTIEASGSDGSKAELQITIPVRKAGSPLVEELSVLTYNLWHGGTQVNDYHRKQIRYFASTNPDIITLQEVSGGHAVRLAEALGWNVYQSDAAGIITRYPIAEVYDDFSRSSSVRVLLDGEKSQVIVRTAHLGFDPYGPYDFCFDHMTVDQVLKREAQSGRTPQILDIVSKIKSQLADSDKVPVILSGDFNAPSHLDYTEAASGLHCGVKDVPWPTSVEPTNAGLVDSYREIHKDPAADPAITWSPIFLDNNGRPEPLDRIDFIYHKGLKTLNSFIEVVGNPKAQPNHADNEWTSDHKSVKTIFQVPSSSRGDEI
ncbi:unnamed protein product [Clonostachys byssicola]|uniref:Endonuclease/exonuclease/phosphatase domain-containing protein n=1 Tax=Clonostachys byssicola TaxID=160290 RepID=A0A9N9Y1A4_9HYPO|nr:unnamed protein product [Clonostachys byssicola]